MLETIKAQLKEKGQEQILRYYDELQEEQKKSLLKQIETIDWSLLERLKQKENKTKERGIIEPLGALEVDEIEKRREEFEAAGIEALKQEKIGAVLLAGGQGTRLGFDNPKGTLNVGETKTLYLFEALIYNIMDVVKVTGAWMPLYIMTSQKNNDETISFFEEHNYFGYNKEYIRFFIQDMAPCVDFEGKLLLEEKDTLALSPNGNGGWFLSLAKVGYLEEMKQRGIEWLSVFAVDNVLQRINDPAFVGATLLSGCECGAKVVRKAEPEEKVGALCLEDGKPSIVEYYELSKEMAYAKDETGNLLYNFGAILNYLFNRNKLEQIMNQEMPVHIVEKKIPYIDEKGVLITPEQPNGYKFEALVLDMIHLMDSCLSYEVVRNREFAPIKNQTGIDSLESARILLKENGVEL